MSIEQARRAFDTFGRFEQKCLEVARDSSQSARSSLQLLNAKIAEITRANAEANFALAMLAESTDVAPAMELQSEQVRKQMDNFVHQLEEMRDLTTKIIQDANPAKTDIGDALTVRNQAPRVEQQQRLVLSLVRRRLHAGRSARLLGRSEGPAGIVADVVEGLVDGAAPAVADGLQVRVVILKPYGEVLLERAAAIDQEVERRPDRDVRAHGRIERDQRAFGGVTQARAAPDDAIEDGLPVFHLADLEVDRVAHRLDEIAGVVDQE